MKVENLRILLYFGYLLQKFDEFTERNSEI